jgi:hypothetical protein
MPLFSSSRQACNPSQVEGILMQTRLVLKSGASCLKCDTIPGVCVSESWGPKVVSFLY